MHRSKQWMNVFAFVCLTLFTLPSASFAQGVEARISSREAYVGSPIVLQLQISNAKKYSLPDSFEVKGCDVEAGTPSQSSQITIFNGRRSESRTVTMQYRITPRDSGRFEIPALQVGVNGESQSTRPFTFVATRSETGDLMFVEIEGKQEKVYVGEPLGLTLKLWLKPFRDREKNLKLNEGQMWQMIADSTRWGPFVERMKEMNGNRQRPGGNPTLRDNGQGEQQEYFLYEIETTIYPTRTGKIDGGDVQLVVDYPLELGRSRDPFDSFFRGSRLGGGSSLMKQMMDDDFFGGSPFGRRMRITKSRPIVANASVDSTEVMPVPLAGKPADYRGAVGRYRIVTQAEPAVVDAGDPVTLRIGIVGDGPMDLVQAPPLANISELNSEFKVVDQSLAGFVQDDTKVFITTIRPRSVAVTEIPPIPFSFFDPAKEAYQTVYSEPIPLTVNEAETLSLDSIVGNSTSSFDGGDRPQQAQLDSTEEPNFDNRDSMRIHDRSVGSSSFPWFWFAVGPPILSALVVGMRWLATFATGDNVWFLGSAEKQAASKIEAADSSDQITESIVKFISQKSKQRTRTTSQTAGDLRMMGLLVEANQFESLIGKLDRYNDAAAEGSLQPLKEDAKQFVSIVAAAIAKSKGKSVRSKRLPRDRRLKKSTAILLFWLLACSSATAADSFSRQQLDRVFCQANQSYDQGRELAATDQAESKIAFQHAVDRYQMIADRGVQSADLYLNLANAQMQCNKMGHAIANYHRALRLDAGMTQAAKNLNFAEQQLADRRTENVDDSLAQSHAIGGLVRVPVELLGSRLVGILFAICSVTFWFLVALRGCGFRFPVWRYGSGLLLIGALSGMALMFGGQQDVPVAIAVVDALELHEGDGDEFPINQTFENALGKKFEVLDRRGGWVQLSASLTRGASGKTGETGWVHQSDVEQIQTNFTD